MIIYFCNFRTVGKSWDKGGWEITRISAIIGRNLGNHGWENLPPFGFIGEIGSWVSEYSKFEVSHSPNELIV
jgi:hypothetical protein